MPEESNNPVSPDEALASERAAREAAEQALHAERMKSALRARGVPEDIAPLLKDDGEDAAERLGRAFEQAVRREVSRRLRGEETPREEMKIQKKMTYKQAENIYRQYNGGKNQCL